MDRPKITEALNAVLHDLGEPGIDPFVREAGLRILRNTEGDPVLASAASPREDLAALLEVVTDENLHPGIDTGPAAGREDW